MGLPLRLFLLALALGAVLPALDRVLAPPLHYPQVDAWGVGSLLGTISGPWSPWPTSSSVR
ncbi:hypothetical protein [Dietzia sp.]|uniref:hypothetical protein n=1 Tax=Dietzia sp. TaxID=1871616 RepID=UPI002FDA4AFB